MRRLRLFSLAAAATPLPAGTTADLIELQARCEATASCLLGHHAWMPWLELPGGTFVTWCCRTGCEASEQWDGAS